MTIEPEPHVVLGVARTATPQEVQRAFQRLVRAHHPDLAGQEPDDAERLRAILSAYAALRGAQDAGAHPAAEAASEPSAPQEPTVTSPPSAPAATPPARRRTRAGWWPQEPPIRVGPVRWHGFRKG